MIGFDTGFFVRLLQRDPTAREVWERIRGGVDEGVISCITLYELARIALKGAISRGAVETLLRTLPQVCRIRWIADPALLDRAARLSHGNALAMADAIILASLMEAGAEEIYTTDSDLEAYTAGPRIVRI